MEPPVVNKISTRESLRYFPDWNTGRTVACIKMNLCMAYTRQ